MGTWAMQRRAIAEHLTELGAGAGGSHTTLPHMRVPALCCRAVSLLYSGQLQEATAALEQGLREHPEGHLHEGLLSNLASMLQLSHPLGSACSKRGRLPHSLPDDFDFGCLEGGRL